MTVYDTDSRSQIQTDQKKAALRSLFELKEASGKSVDLYFAPAAPQGQEHRWIKTLPGKGWFAYFRIYDPQSAYRREAVLESRRSGRASPLRRL